MFPSQADIEEAPEETRSEFCGNLGIFWRFINFFSQNKKKIRNFFLGFSPTELYKEYRMLKQQGKASDSSGKTGSQEIPNVEQVLGNPL